MIILRIKSPAIILFSENTYQYQSLITFFFSRNEKHTAQVRNSVHSSSSINAIQHMFASASLPFGGVGSSGMGRYHGKTEKFIRWILKLVIVHIQNILTGLVPNKAEGLVKK